MNLFTAIKDVKDAADEVEIVEECNDGCVAPITLHSDTRRIIEDIKPYKKVILAVLRFGKVIFGPKVDRILDKVIVFIEIIL